MQAQSLVHLGMWVPDTVAPAFSPQEFAALIPRFREPIYIIREGNQGRLGLGQAGHILPDQPHSGQGYPLLASLPALYPEWLGDRSFLETHHLRFPYVAGAMYRGIASTSMVIAMAKAGMLGFFGAGGCSPAGIESALDEIQTAAGLTRDEAARPRARGHQRVPQRRLPRRSQRDRGERAPHRSSGHLATRGDDEPHHASPGHDGERGDRGPRRERRDAKSCRRSPRASRRISHPPSAAPDGLLRSAPRGCHPQEGRGGRRTSLLPEEALQQGW